ncbi:uncharacterized protein LOC126841919 [Adelges cooleyi]|uniref:uncharacterized protein LOC126841919 n=1 Tax=Adelges cooleyi TaxID=133065 RepID=UPI0021801997|nr:uncharacterized protein LOC126841919 [Adelges cooleyi]
MAPKLVVGQNRHKLSQLHSDIYLKKMNHYMLLNTRLRKRITQYSIQNRQLSGTRNNLLLQNMTLEKELNTLKNSNVVLTAMYQTVSKKLKDLEQTLKSCVPAIVTLSQFIPSMMQNVHELLKFDQFDQFCSNEKTEQSKMVRPNLISKTKVSVLSNHLSMSPIIESATPEQTPKLRKRSSSFRGSPQQKLSSESYVRLKDVAQLLKNSKSVHNESSPKQSVSSCEELSWLFQESQEIKEPRNSINNNSTEIPNSSTPTKNECFANDFNSLNASVSSTSDNHTTNFSYESDNTSNGKILTPESSILKNITCRRKINRRSSESSTCSEVNDSISLHRTRRNATSNVSYKEPLLNKKLRRAK